MSFYSIQDIYLSLYPSMKICIYLLLVFLFFFHVECFEIDGSSPIVHAEFATYIKYQQKIGSCMVSNQLSQLNKIINQASAYYKSDYQQNLKYIKQNMDTEFGSKNTSYIVFILHNETKSNNYFQRFYNLEGCNYALLAKGINKINPTWSYLIYKVVQKSSYTLNYVHQISKGQGISPDVQSVIKNTILAAEGKQTKCNCLSITITFNLQKYDDQLWNAICMPSNDIYGYFLSKNSQWMMTHPRLCYYFLYVKQ